MRNTPLNLIPSRQENTSHTFWLLGLRLGQGPEVDDADEVLALGGDEECIVLLGHLADGGVHAAIRVLQASQDRPGIAQFHHDAEVGVVENHVVLH